MKKKADMKPRAPDNIRAIPIFREKPDVEKLGRAIIALSEYLAKEKKEGRHEKAA